MLNQLQISKTAQHSPRSDLETQKIEVAQRSEIKADVMHKSHLAIVINSSNSAEPISPQSSPQSTRQGETDQVDEGQTGGLWSCLVFTTTLLPTLALTIILSFIRGAIEGYNKAQVSIKSKFGEPINIFRIISLILVLPYTLILSIKQILSDLITCRYFTESNAFCSSMLCA